MEQQLTMNETEPAAEKSGKGADTAKPVTRATKAKRQKEILRALLEKKPYKWNELLEEAVKEYTAKYPEENADIPDIKGKFGSNFSLMEDAGEVLFDKATNMCSLKVEEPKKRGRKPAAGKAEKTLEAVQEKEEEKRTAIEESLKKAVEKAVAKAEALGRKRTKKSVAETAEMQAAEPTSGAKPEAKSEAKSEAKAEEKPQPKKRGRKPAAKAAEPVPAPADSLAPAPVTEEKPAEKPAEKEMEKAAEKTMKNAPEKAAEKPVAAASAPVKAAEKKEEQSPAKAEKTPAKKDAFKDLWLTDFVFLGNASSAKKEEKAASKAEAALAAKAEEKSEPKEESAAETKLTEEKSAEKSAEAKEDAKPLQTAQTSPKSAAQNTQNTQNTQNAQNVQSTQKAQTSAGTRTAQPRETSSRTAQPQTRAAARTAPSRETSSRIAQSAVSPRTADEKLKEEFLKRLRALSGEYFEYYSVYLLERYSLKSGRRLEGLRISGGKNDGGIDGEIELTDRFGFRETIYIQAKNWDPTKGLVEKWMIGETLVQQFVGAATCRQMRDGKRNCRGIFVTTSTFTKDAKDALEVLGEKFIGYDGNDVFETAKECGFGLIKVNGVWQLDEKLLAGDKAFFNLI